MSCLQSLLTPAFWSPGPGEWIIIAVVAVLLFGRRLPELGRSLGRGLVEFKRGLREVNNEIAAAERIDPERESHQAAYSREENAPPPACPVPPEKPPAADES